MRQFQYMDFIRKLPTFSRSLLFKVQNYLHSPFVVLAIAMSIIGVTLLFLVSTRGSSILINESHLIDNRSTQIYGMIALFLNSVFSSLIPIPTEISTSILLLLKVNKIIIFIILDVGSIIGGYLAYLIGKKFDWFMERKLNGAVKPQFISKLLNFINRHALLLYILYPWLPLVGDGFYFLAGATRYDLRKFLIYTAIGKSIKALAIIGLLASIIPYL
jgi:membrane protein YqaA with SNARE-associated domain